MEFIFRKKNINWCFFLIYPPLSLPPNALAQMNWYDARPRQKTYCNQEMEQNILANCRDISSCYRSEGRHAKNDMAQEVLHAYITKLLVFHGCTYSQSAFCSLTISAHLAHRSSSMHSYCHPSSTKPLPIILSNSSAPSSAYNNAWQVSSINSPRTRTPLRPPKTGAV